MIAYYTLWAHQIKTPIAAMKLTLQYEDSHLARQISGDLFRIEQYVEMVMMFLRLGSSSTDYVIREYELTPILNQTIKKFAGEFILRKLTIHYEPVEATVLTDEKWLSFVIEQLLSNALKYTRKGGITIRYDVEKHTTEKANDGIGIVPWIYKKAYDYYYAIWLAQQKNENKILINYIPEDREIVIPRPKAIPYRRHLFSFLDESEE